MEESVIYQDILQKGQQQGQHQEAFSFCQKLLESRFRELDSAVWERVQQLSVEQLEALGRALFELNQVNDLMIWLEQQKQN